MNCDELLPNYILYATGKMEEPELSELRAHLARGCPDCTAGVRIARAFADSMGTVLAAQGPSAQLRERVLAIPDEPAAPGPRLVTAEHSQSRPRFWFRPMPVWLGSALAAACVVLALIPGLAWRYQSEAMLAREQQSAALLREQVARLQHTPDHTASRAQGVPIFSLEFVRSGGGSEAPQTLKIPRGAGAIVLALPIDLVQRASAAELRNASDQNIWTASPLLSGASDSIGLTIPGEVLQAGRYSIVLRAGDRILARVPFQVTLDQ